MDIAIAAIAVATVFAAVLTVVIIILILTCSWKNIIIRKNNMIRPVSNEV